MQKAGHSARPFAFETADKLRMRAQWLAPPDIPRRFSLRPSPSTCHPQAARQRFPERKHNFPVQWSSASLAPPPSLPCTKRNAVLRQDQKKLGKRFGSTGVSSGKLVRANPEVWGSGAHRPAALDNPSDPWHEPTQVSDLPAPARFPAISGIRTRA